MARPPDEARKRRANRALAMGGLLGAALVLAASFIQGSPNSVPAIALGWPLILYLERAGFVALLVMGVGGAAYRLLTGGQISQAGGVPPTVGIEEQTKPAEALKEAWDADVKAIDKRLADLEREAGKHGSSD